jgi:hypothetical protein
MSSRLPGTPGFGPAAFGPPVPPPRPTRRLSVWIWIVVIVGGIAVVVGGAVGLGLWLVQRSDRIMSDQVAETLKDSPTIKQHLGDITACVFDRKATAAFGSSDHFFFEVRGTKGEAVLKVQIGNQSDEEIEILSASLILPEGGSYPVQ